MKNIITLKALRFIIDEFSSLSLEYFIILKKCLHNTFFGFKNVRYVLKEQLFLILAFDDCCFMMTNVYLPIFKEERNYC